jgi:hypothetical protein
VTTSTNVRALEQARERWKAVVVPGITILRFVNGRFVERWSQADFPGLLIQLGALPSPS